MRKRAWIVVAVAVVMATGAVGVVSSAQGSSARKSLPKGWALLPGTARPAVVPQLAGATTLTLIGTNFVATGIDNPPSGTSQGDELAVSGQVQNTHGQGVGELHAQEVLTSAANPSAMRILVTATVLLAAGQLTVIGVQRTNHPDLSRFAVVGGAGAYANVSGQMVATPAGSNTRLTFQLLRS
jgi:hypothetical protein